MKNLTILLLIIFLQSCEKYDDTYETNCVSNSWPSAPYGTPDDKSTYIDDGYRSIDYIYYCHNGQYVSITYTQADYCEEWEKSTFTSSGICD